MCRKCYPERKFLIPVVKDGPVGASACSGPGGKYRHMPQLPCDAAPPTTGKPVRQDSTRRSCSCFFLVFQLRRRFNDWGCAELELYAREYMKLRGLTICNDCTQDILGQKERRSFKRIREEEDPYAPNHPLPSKQHRTRGSLTRRYSPFRETAKQAASERRQRVLALYSRKSGFPEPMEYEQNSQPHAVSTESIVSPPPSTPSPSSHAPWPKDIPMTDTPLTSDKSSPHDQRPSMQNPGNAASGLNTFKHAAVAQKPSRVAGLADSKYATPPSIPTTTTTPTPPKTPSPEAPTFSFPRVGAGYSTSSKACQPKRK